MILEHLYTHLLGSSPLTVLAQSQNGHSVLGIAHDSVRMVQTGFLLVLTVGLTIVFLRLVPWTERLVLRLVVRRPDGTNATSTQLELQARVHTLTAVVGSFTRVVVLSFATIMILGQLGMEIKPLLAGAGIAGVAMGFGAQSIVKDFFSGFFILLEDQYDVGDTVTIGTVTGTVERMTLRITVLRDVQGTAYFIPNSAITQVANRTHDWSRAAVDVVFAAKISVEDAHNQLERVKLRAQQHRLFVDHHQESLLVEGPNELENGATRWTVSIKAPPLQAPAFKRALVTVTHQVLTEQGFAPDGAGRMSN
jgi:small-conductance mechanosensitive channel